MKRFIILLILVLWDTNPSFSRQSERQPFRDGEALKFKVRWGFVTLGTIVMKQEKKDSTSFTVTLAGDSSPLLKFIDAAFVNKAAISTKQLTSFEYTSEIGRKKNLHIFHRLDPKTNKLSVLEEREGRNVVNVQFNSGESLFNDLNFLMYVRMFSGSGKETRLFSVFKDTVVSTTLKLSRETKRVNVDAFKDPQEAFVFDAKSEFTNREIAGFGGDFRGYVGADDRALLLKLEAKVLLGSIVIELESFQ